MRILEVHLEVNDIEKSLGLYSKLIPHKKITRWKDCSAAALVLDDGTAFGLWKAGKFGIHNGRGGKHVHFAFQINTDELEKYRKLLLACGLEPLDFDWPNGTKSIYFFDYDGHQGEFMTNDWTAFS